MGLSYGVNCSTFIVHYLLHTVYYILHRSLFTADCRLQTVDCLLFYCISIYFNLFLNFWFIVHCLSSLFTVYCLLFTVYCSPFTVYRLPFTVYRLPFTVYRVFVLFLLFVYTLTPTIHISSICSCSPRHFSIVSSRICFCSSIVLICRDMPC